MNLPTEIIDRILVIHNDFNTAVSLKNEYVIKKLYDKNKHTWNWAAENGCLDVVKWLYTNTSKGNVTRAIECAAKWVILRS